MTVLALLGVSVAIAALAYVFNFGSGDRRPIPTIPVEMLKAFDAPAMSVSEFHDGGTVKVVGRIRDLAVPLTPAQRPRHAWALFVQPSERSVAAVRGQFT